MFKTNKSRIITLLAFSLLTIQASSAPDKTNEDTIRSSSLGQALQYLNSIPIPDSSIYWPNISPVYLMENLKGYVKNPLYTFESTNTNFCGYTALSFVTLDRDPVGFIKFLVKLYTDGNAQFGRAVFKPSAAVRQMAGKLKYKGILDINPATQMWFLSLADHFKGYLNTFNLQYNEGDEHKLWASTNFAKFNRMLRRLFDWKVVGRGADLVRPPIDNLYPFLKEKLETGTVFLYLNNRLLYRKKHVVAIRIGMPTHYVVLLSISQEEDGRLNIAYMDGGRKTYQQVDPELLRKIVYGVTYCTDIEK